MSYSLSDYWRKKTENAHHKLDICKRDRRHANLIGGAREEGGERRDERYRALATAEADAHADHILLGDVALDVALGILFGEHF